MQFFTLRVQLILFIVSSLLTVVFHWQWGFAASWIPFLVVLFLAVKYIILGTVNGALMQMQMGDFEGAERTLDYTRWPQWLRFGYHGVFFMLKSQFAFQRQDYEKAETFANKALTLDLQADMAAGMYLELIQIYGMRKNVQKVREYLKEAKKLPVTMPQIKEKLKEVELMLEGKHEAQQKMMQKPRHSPYAAAPSFMKRGRKR